MRIEQVVQLDRALQNINGFVFSASARHDRVICVNYIPLYIWQDNIEYYCVVQQPEENTDSCKLVFKRAYGSSKCLEGIMRKHNTGYDRIAKLLDKLSTTNKSGTPQDLLNAVQLLRQPLQNFITVMSEGQVIAEELSETVLSFADNIEYLADNHNASAISASIDALATTLEAATRPDNTHDLLQYIRDVYNLDDAELAGIHVTHIKEVLAQNILVQSSLPSAENDHAAYVRHMLAANAELLHLFADSFFTKNITSMRFHSDRAAMFEALPEFVPIAMKFSGVDNPLLELNSEIGSCIFDEMREDFAICKNAEVCTMHFNALGQVDESLDVLYDAEDPGTYIYSRVYYCLCSDLAEFYTLPVNLRLAPISAGADSQNRWLYTADLSTTVMFTMHMQYAERAAFAKGGKFTRCSLGISTSSIREFDTYARLADNYRSSCIRRSILKQPDRGDTLTEANINIATLINNMDLAAGELFGGSVD